MEIYTNDNIGFLLLITCVCFLMCFRPQNALVMCVPSFFHAKKCRRKHSESVIDLTFFDGRINRHDFDVLFNISKIASQTQYRLCDWYDVRVSVCVFACIGQSVAVANRLSSSEKFQFRSQPRGVFVEIQCARRYVRLNDSRLKKSHALKRWTGCSKL